jgi:hypothetical protein
LDVNRLKVVGLQVKTGVVLVLNAWGFWWPFVDLLLKLLNFFSAHSIDVVILNENLVPVLLLDASHSKTELVVLN